MSDAHVREDRLHDWVEGLLDADDDARVRAHVASCDVCGAEAAAIRSLRDAAASLPRELDPGVDLRPGIRAAARARSRPRSAAPLAAAAVLALVAGAIAVAALRDGGGSTAGGPVAGSVDAGAAAPGGAAPGGAASAAEMVLALDREYERAGAELRARVRSGTPRLDPETARLVAREIAAVEAALTRSRTALREDPASPVVRDLVLTAHRQRLDVLRRATELTAERGEG